MSCLPRTLFFKFIKFVTKLSNNALNEIIHTKKMQIGTHRMFFCLYA